MRSVVVGIGTPLLTDDAVGIEVARAVRFRLEQDTDSLGNVDVLETMTGGLGLVEAMVGYDDAIVVDAIDPTEGEAGSLRELSLAQAVRTRSSVLSHDSSPEIAFRFYSELGVPLPRRVVVLGIVGDDLTTFGTRLTGAGAEAVPRAADRVLELLAVGLTAAGAP